MTRHEPRELTSPLPRWHLDAACATVYVPRPGGRGDPWFPEKGDRGGDKAARRVCACCPVRVACLRDAVVNHDDYGMRGGLSPRERKHLGPT